MSVPLFNQLTGLSTDSNQIDRYDRLTIYTFIVRPLPPPPELQSPTPAPLVQ